MKKGRTDEELQKADGEKESAWPRELRIGSGEEFRQSFAVAHLAVKLCELKKAEIQKQWEAEDKRYSHDSNTAVTDHEKKQMNEGRQKQMELRMRTLAPEGFLDEAWKLIQRARKRVLRPQTGSDEAIEEVVEHRLQPNVPFKKLCDPERDKGAVEIIKLHNDVTGKPIEVEWRVYTIGKALDKLFWAYWRFKSTLTDNNKWKEYGEALLASWKKNGLPPNTFLALAKFRREHDKRALNLKKKPKGKLKRAAVKR
jgi:hypothetical protein